MVMEYVILPRNDGVDRREAICADMVAKGFPVEWSKDVDCMILRCPYWIIETKSGARCLYFGEPGDTVPDYVEGMTR